MYVYSYIALCVYSVHKKVSAFCGVCVTVVNRPLFITNTDKYSLAHSDSCNLIKQFAMPLSWNPSGKYGNGGRGVLPGVIALLFCHSN